jgi:phosphoribosylamine-glycine ligase
VESDPDDKYGLAKQLLKPLRPWFRKVDYHGPIQVTACRHRGKWKVIEYNIRLGITSGAMILRMLEQPVNTLWTTVCNQKLAPRLRKEFSFGCSMTLAGYGYPYLRVRGPRTAVSCLAPFDCDVWWNEVEGSPENGLMAVGQRIADVIAFGETREAAVSQARANIQRIRSLGAFYRTDIGRTLWPPGMDD